MTFALMISEAVRSADPNADDAHVSRVVAGVSADPAWRDLTFLTRDLAAGTLATQLAARAVTISKALQRAESMDAPSAQPQSVASRYEMTDQEFRALPPAKKRELREAAEKHDAREEQAGADVAGLQAKLAAGTITPTEKLTLAHLTPGPTKAQRRDPAWKRAQEESASLETLRRNKYGHDVEAASGARPPTYREMHRQHSERIAAIIKKREDAGEV